MSDTMQFIMRKYAYSIYIYAWIAADDVLIYLGFWHVIASKICVGLFWTQCLVYTMVMCLQWWLSFGSFALQCLQLLVLESSVQLCSRSPLQLDTPEMTAMMLAWLTSMFSAWVVKDLHFVSLPLQAGRKCKVWSRSSYPGKAELSPRHFCFSAPCTRKVFAKLQTYHVLLSQPICQLRGVLSKEGSRLKKNLLLKDWLTWRAR